MAQSQQAVAIREVGQSLESMEPRFASGLPAHIPAKKFVRTAINALQRAPEILRDCDRRSIYEACMLAAQDGLILDGREAALVKFGNRAQYMPMVQGLLKKARQSGQISSISAQVVYENDMFDYELGDAERIVHRPHLGARGKPIAVYAIAKLADGGTQREVMSVQEVEAIRSISRAKGAGPWKDHWAEMARKTVLRRLLKYLPYSTDLDGVIAAEGDDDDAPITDEDRAEAITPEPAPRQPAKARQKVKEAQPPEPEPEPEHDPETGEVVQEAEVVDDGEAPI